MLLVLDSNEYVFALGIIKKGTSVALLDTILATSPLNTIRIPRMIVEEVKHNITPEAFKEFIGFITSITSVDEDLFVPFELGAKFEKYLKPVEMGTVLFLLFSTESFTPDIGETALRRVRGSACSPFTCSGQAPITGLTADG